MIIFPVRHHSPAASLQLRRLVAERRPKAVLVEGPEDATPLIPLLLDEATEPPVALYAYFGDNSPSDLQATSGQVQAVYYPFCDYSPELVALREGLAVGAQLSFCDIPAAATLRYSAYPDDAPDAGASPSESQNVPTQAAGPAPTALPGFGDFAEAVTRASGFDSFEAFWEAAFEQEAAGRPTPEFVALLTTFGSQARSFNLPARDRYNDTRERHMAAVARRLVADGISPDDLLLVCGAAHAGSVARHFHDSDGTAGTDGETLSAQQAQQAQIALIPFSFPRLSEQLGYGAGNRAPWFYQLIWSLGGAFADASRRSLIALARHLRRQGHQASLAQCIDGAALATVLASIRGKSAPGLDELRDAAIACFGQGQPGIVSGALSSVMIGDALGKVTPRVGRTPLQAEFYATTQRLRLPVLDAPKQLLLHMVIPREAEQSIFLQRLSVADIPFATEMASGLGASRAASPSPVHQLARVREKWQLQWTPATDGQLVERTAWGSTLEEVCGRILLGRLDRATKIDAGTVVLLQLALCDLSANLTRALARCEALAGDSASFPSLARAAYHLDGLLSFGAARTLPVDRLRVLARRLFTRAMLHLPSSAGCSDEAAIEVQEALTAVHDQVQRGSLIVESPESFWNAVATVAEMPGAHGSLRGLALVLLELGGRLAPDELTSRLRYWLSRGAEAAENARLVAGLYSLHRGTLLRNTALIGAVTEFLAGLSLEQLTPLLPVLRRGLGDLSAAERAYLTETLAKLLGTNRTRTRQALRLSSTDLSVLREADAAVEAVLQSWGERYGIR